MTESSKAIHNQKEPRSKSRAGDGEPVNNLRIDPWVSYEKLTAAAFYIIPARDGDGDKGIKHLWPDTQSCPLIST